MAISFSVPSSLQVTGTVTLSAYTNTLLRVDASGVVQTTSLQSNLSLSGGVLGLATSLTSINAITSAAASDLVLTGNGGGSITVGQGANGTITLTPTGTGIVYTTKPVEVNVLANNQIVLGASGANFGFVSNVNSTTWALGYGGTIGTLGTSALTWDSSGNVKVFGSTASTNTSTGAFIVVGGAGIGGALNVGSNISPGAGSFIAGSLYTDANQGLVIGAKTGATRDFLLADPSGNAIIGVATGTKNVTLGGNLTVSGTTTATGAVTNNAGSTAHIFNSTSTYAAIRFNESVVAKGFIGIDYANAICSTSTNGDLILRSDAGNLIFSSTLTERMRISGAGNMTLAGNLTVSGTGTHTFAGQIQTTGAASNPGANGQGNVGANSTAGLQLVGQGSVQDVTIYNKAGTSVITIPTGTTGVNVAGTITVGGTGTSSFAGSVTSAKSTDNSLTVTTTGTANAAKLILNSGDGTTSGRFSYITLSSLETSSQTWNFGMYGEKPFSIRDGSTAFLSIANSTGAVTLASTSTATNTSSGALVVGSNVGLSGNAGGASFFGGNLNASGNLIVAGTGVSSVAGVFRVNPANQSTAAWGVNGVNGQFNSNNVTDTSTASSGTAASAAIWSFQAGTGLYATNTGVTTTDAAMVYIGGNVLAGTNQTITNSWGLWNVGNTRLDGKVMINSTTDATTGGAGSLTTAGGIYAAKNLVLGGGVISNSAGISIQRSGTTQAQWFVDASNNIVLGVGSGAGTTAITVTSGGSAGLGGAANSAYGLYVSPSALSGTSQYGLVAQPTATSAATSATAGISTRAATAAASFTVTSGRGIEITAPSLGAGSAITTQQGLFIANQGASGVTNAYGIDIAAQSGAATTNVGLRNAGTSLLTGDVTFGGAALSTSATAGIGYTTGAGGTVTQATSRTTGVTLNKVTGQITLFTAAGTSAWTTFTVTNSAVAVGDTVRVTSQTGTTDIYQAFAHSVAAGSFKISFQDITGTTSEAPILNYTVFKGSAS